MPQLDKEIERLVRSLDEDNDRILKRFEFVSGHQRLTFEEGSRFLDFLRRALSEKDGSRPAPH
ncbi:hypothetical protein I8J29_32775 [Paenibacillus sp. MWE-103]|uniref:Uncharacterized protein n=1 Tax=Paenibacillus artemisiicola TaxID=1172618 RepID=A0ABS3WL53_9BACL|nr:MULTISPECIES: hypothetical protein [Paenibacillus]MBO7748948.1 hypothetical protein [Paenibacillus artemisiicola]SFI79362.1 hypothetical protein SAMN02799624_02218 [Paenibacillus sp. UNC496MF]